MHARNNLPRVFSLLGVQPIKEHRTRVAGGERKRRRKEGGAGLLSNSVIGEAHRSLLLEESARGERGDVRGHGGWGAAGRRKRAKCARRAAVAVVVSGSGLSEGGLLEGKARKPQCLCLHDVSHTVTRRWSGWKQSDARCQHKEIRAVSVLEDGIVSLLWTEAAGRHLTGTPIA